MRFRVSPDDNRVLPDPNPTAHHPPSVNGNHRAPIDPAKVEISTLTNTAIPYQVGDGKAKSVLPLIPANPETAVMSTRPVTGNKAGGGKAKSVLLLIPATPETAVTSTVTSSNSHGYRAGVGKVKSVIPKKRKLVKTMMYHYIKNFLISLFRRPPKTHNRPKPITDDQ